MKEHKANREFIGFTLISGLISFGYNVVTVSYTHLDVYKRQVSANSGKPPPTTIIASAFSGTFSTNTKLLISSMI